MFCGTPTNSDLISAAKEGELRPEAAVVAGLRLEAWACLVEPLNELPP